MLRFGLGFGIFLDLEYRFKDGLVLKLVLAKVNEPLFSVLRKLRLKY